MKKQVKVYAEQGHAEQKDWLRHLIHPIRAWWGDGTAQWEQWAPGFEFYKDLFVLSDEIEESDAVFLPMTLNYYIKNKKMRVVNDLIFKAQAVNKVTYAWVDGDHQILYDNPGCVFLKYSGFRSKSKPNELILSGDMKKDLLFEYFNGRLVEKKKNERPLVGFDGTATYPIFRLGGLIMKNSIAMLVHYLLRTQYVPDPVLPSLLQRKRILHQLEKIDGIDTNFNIRDSFAVGTVGGNKVARSEYINNIFNSDYTFCYRGAANYSLRFYESLCLGRIPLFVNTDCMLPFADKVSWKDVCLWVEEKNIKHIGDAILDFHHSITASEFIDRQHYCREIWLKYCDNEGFYSEFHSYLYNNLIDLNINKYI